METTVSKIRERRRPRMPGDWISTRAGEWRRLHRLPVLSLHDSHKTSKVASMEDGKIRRVEEGVVFLPQ